MSAIETKPHVLLVDDEPLILESLRDLLEDEFEVMSSTDPQEALRLLEKSQFAVILADQRMPNLPGDQLLSRAREISDATRILITGYTDINALIRAVNDGQIFTYLPKPWEPIQLKVTVFKAAKHSRELTQRRVASQRLDEQRAALARSEANLRHQTKLLQLILDSMGDGVLVTDEIGRMVLLNPAAEQMVGSDARESLHADWSRLHGIYRPDTNVPYPPEQLPLSRAMRGEAVDGIEMFVKNHRIPEGRYVSVNARPLRDDFGESIGGVAVVRDTTLAKKVADQLQHAKEEAERANRAKSEFLSRMSHELRTPLNAILGFAQLLQLGQLDEVNTDNVQQILKGGYHLLELINEVLDLSRIEAGRLAVSCEPVLLHEVLQEAADLIRPLASQRNVRLDIEGGLRCGHRVEADRQRLKQVFLNLFGNAVKFNREGGSVWVVCRDLSSDRLRVEVCDTGMGINQQDLTKVFVPFERLGADGAGIEGSGLGLALSRRLMEAMGGTIEVQSKFGIGSRFSVELPIVPEEDAPAESRIPIAAQDDPSLSLRGTVLYIEDNLPNLQLIERLLGRFPGIRLLAAMQGKLGIDLAQAYRPDWILLDLHLPDMPGNEVLEELKSQTRTQEIPVTVVSADATPAQVVRLKEAGARDYVTKPFDVRQLLQLLEATLQKAEAR